MEPSLPLCIWISYENRKLLAEAKQAVEEKYGIFQKVSILNGAHLGELQARGGNYFWDNPPVKTATFRKAVTGVNPRFRLLIASNSSGITPSIASRVDQYIFTKCSLPVLKRFGVKQQTQDDHRWKVVTRDRKIHYFQRAPIVRK